MSPVQLALSSVRSRHDCADATEIGSPLQLRMMLRCLCHFRQLAVSCWHSLPDGTGTFPTTTVGVVSSSVRCEAVLLLLPKMQLDLPK